MNFTARELASRLMNRFVVTNRDARLVRPADIEDELAEEIERFTKDFQEQLDVLQKRVDALESRPVYYFPPVTERPPGPTIIPLPWNEPAPGWRPFVGDPPWWTGVPTCNARTIPCSTTCGHKDFPI